MWSGWRQYLKTINLLSPPKTGDTVWGVHTNNPYIVHRSYKDGSVAASDYGTILHAEAYRQTGALKHNEWVRLQEVSNDEFIEASVPRLPVDDP